MRHARRRLRSRNSGRRPQGLNHDGLSNLGAKSKPGIADHTDNIGTRRKEPYDLIFAKANLTQAIGYLRRGAELFDSHRHACLYTIERAPGICTGICRTAFGLHTAKTLISGQRMHSTDFVIG
jgi:hypothetical protein